MAEQSGDSPGQASLSIANERARARPSQHEGFPACRARQGSRGTPSSARRSAKDGMSPRGAREAPAVNGRPSASNGIGVLYSLADGPLELDPRRHEDRLAPVTCPSHAAIVEEVLRFDDLPPGSLASRRAVVRWSDGSEGEALRWYADEILICEGDHGNSRLMSSRVEMPGAAGSTGERRAHIICRRARVAVRAW
jgi:hypothetical protein